MKVRVLLICVAATLVANAAGMDLEGKAKKTDETEASNPSLIPVVPWKMFAVANDTNATGNYDPSASICKQRTLPDTTVVDTNQQNPEGYQIGKIKVQIAPTSEQDYPDSTSFLFPHCTWGADLTPAKVDTWVLAWFDVCGVRFSINPFVNLREGPRQNDVVSDHFLKIGPLTKARLDSCPDASKVDAVLNRCTNYINSAQTLLPKFEEPFSVSNWEAHFGWSCKQQTFTFSRAESPAPIIENSIIDIGTSVASNDSNVFNGPHPSLGTLRSKICADLLDETVHGNQETNYVHNLNEPTFEAVVVNDEIRCVRFPEADLLLDWRFKHSFEITDNDLIDTLETYDKFYVADVTGVYVTSATSTGGITFDMKNTNLCADQIAYEPGYGCKLNKVELSIIERNILKEEPIEHPVYRIDKSKIVVTGHLNKEHIINSIVDFQNSGLEVSNVELTFKTTFTPHYLDNNGNKVEFVSGGGGGRRLSSLRRLETDVKTITFTRSETSEKAMMYQANTIRGYAEVEGDPGMSDVLQWLENHFVDKLRWAKSAPIEFHDDKGGSMKDVYYTINILDARLGGKKVFVDFDFVFSNKLKIASFKATSKISGITFTEDPAQGKWNIGEDTHDEEDDDLSTGAIVGIVIGALSGAVLLIVSGYYCLRAGKQMENKVVPGGAASNLARHVGQRYSVVPVLGPEHF